MNYPVVNNIDINQKFNYLWLKYVNDVNLNVHCARCLKGEYSEMIFNELETGKDINLNEHEAKVYYLCGVAKPSCWDNNFHLAFVYKKDSTIEIEEHGISIKIQDAERIDIVPVDLEKSKSKHKYSKLYNTCRNWQFAHQFIDMFGTENKIL